MSFREGPFNDLKVPLTWTAAVSVIVAIVIGAALLLSDRRETVQTQAYGVGRRVFDTADRPVSTVISAPTNWLRQASDFTSDYLFAVSENRKLKQQVADLRRWRDTAIALQDTNARYKAILGLKTDPPIPMVTGRVVLDSRGPFANTRLADIGSDKGVRVGNPVMSDRGIIGRVVGVTNEASRVLLLTDVASRTPVLIDRTDARAILLGDGGVFPRGLPVGVAAKGLDGQWRVRLDADLTAIDFVRVLEFEDFTALVNEKQLDASGMPPLSPAEQTKLDAARTAAAVPAKPAAKSAAATTAPGSGSPAKPGSAVSPPAKPTNGAKVAAASSSPAAAPASSSAPVARPDRGKPPAASVPTRTPASSAPAGVKAGP